MGDGADLWDEQGEDAWFLHCAKRCDELDRCQYCEEEEKEKEKLK